MLLLSLLAPQAVAEDPMSGHAKYMFGAIRQIALKSAETMPEESYSFKPADSVRTYGQIVGHVADSQYFFCSTALGEKNPAPRIEKSKSAKADLVAALKESFDYCEKAYAMNDATGTEKVKLMSTEQPRLGVLYVNIAHTMEHYGNLVTYLRMKGFVPPTSDQEFMKQLAPR
jgi:uncharacterized damage-inducible protein DinB